MQTTSFRKPGFDFPRTDTIDDLPAWLTTVVDAALP